MKKTNAFFSSMLLTLCILSIHKTHAADHIHLNLEDGQTHWIIKSVGNGKVLSSGGNQKDHDRVRFKPSLEPNPPQNRLWKFVRCHDDHDYYKIICNDPHFSEKALRTKDGTNEINKYSLQDPGNHQKWKIVKKGNYYTFTNYSTRLALDASIGDDIRGGTSNLVNGNNYQLFDVYRYNPRPGNQNNYNY